MGTYVILVSMHKIKVFIQHIYRSHYSLWLCSGLLTGISLLIVPLWVLFFPGLLLQLHLMYKKTASSKKVFIGAMLAGTVHMLLVLVWLWSLVPLDWIGIDSPFLYKTLILFIWITASMVIGFGYALCLSLFRYIAGNQVWLLLVLFPFGVLTGEMVGRMLYSLYSLGVDSSLNISFGIGHIGYALTQSNVFIPFAMFGGVYILSFIAGVLASTIYFVMCKMKTNTKNIIFLSSVLFVLMGTAKVSLPFRTDYVLPKNVALITTDLPVAAQKNNNSIVIKQAVTSALNRGFTTIVTPEDARYLETFKTKKNALKNITQQYGDDIVLVDTSNESYRGKNVLRATTLDTKRQKIYEYDKQYLVPGGEYMPIFLAFVVSLFDSDIVDNALMLFGYQRGISVSDVVLPDEVPPVLFCYESIVPTAVSNIIKNKKPTFVAHVVSHAWFTDTQGYLRTQLQTMVRVQAVYNNVIIGQSSNSTPSVVYTPDGNIFEADQLENNQIWRVDSLTDLVDR